MFFLPPISCSFGSETLKTHRSSLPAVKTGGGVMSVDAAGPVFVGVKRAFRREKGEHQPVIGEDVLTAFNQRYYPEQVGKDNEI